MNLKEIASSAAALGNQVKAGIPIDQALLRLAQMQPSYADFWTRASIAVQSGQPLSELLAEVWPDTLVFAVQAGERSGKLDEVFGRIEETIELQLDLRGSLAKLIYPVGMGIAGLAVFIGFMVFVLPGLSKSLNTKSDSFIFWLSLWMSEFFKENLVAIVAGLVVGVIFMVGWLRTDGAKSFIIEILFSIPVLKDALRDMYFGLWSYYMATMFSAGITTTEALKLTSKILPPVLQESVLIFEWDLSVNHRSMSDSADPAKQSPADPRAVWWPFYIANAFIVSEQTGEVDKELMRVAPALIKEGVKTLNRVIAVANAVMLIVSASMIVSPLAAYYVEIFSAVRQVGR
jgi:type IV pilus assembly protein PilC